MCIENSQFFFSSRVRQIAISCVPFAVESLIANWQNRQISMLHRYSSFFTGAMMPHPQNFWLASRLVSTFYRLKCMVAAGVKSNNLRIWKNSASKVAVARQEQDGSKLTGKFTANLSSRQIVHGYLLGLALKQLDNIRSNVLCTPPLSQRYTRHCPRLLLG